MLQWAAEWQEASDWARLPCREFCNARSRGCEPGRCCNPYERSDPRYWLGRGNQPVGSVGWAHNMERDAIRAHLRRRLWKFGLDGMAAMRLESRVSEIQRRLQRDYHRRKPPIGARRAIGAAAPAADLSREQLEHIVALWADANDPVSVSVATWAADRLRILPE